MKISILALVAALGMLGVALGMNYGYGHMPIYPRQQTDNSLLMLIGLLFLLMILFNGNLFNTTSSTSGTPITVVQG